MPEKKIFQFGFGKQLNRLFLKFSQNIILNILNTANKQPAF